MRSKIILDKSYRGKNSTLFTGRPEGVKVRAALKLDEKDNSNEYYAVYIPAGTTSFNASFFLGLFFDSIKKIGSIDKFKEKYTIYLDDLEEKLRPSIQRNLNECYRKAENELNNSTGLD
ncbi:hypothetical protein [Bacteroides ndongoniae]|uniref:hypothetical protein n=1 Tax=Bacteroides ndongoniae TaxID=1903262 RepID=UPI0023F64D8A|nr:hypothetical protein [Bacteroides ndongoniae]